MPYAGIRMGEDKKDPIAQAMVRKRWDKTSKAERSEYARKLNEARWGKKKRGKGKKRGKRKEEG